MKMVKKILCIFIFTLVVISACEASTKWVKYVNERYGYSIDYPSNIFVKCRKSDSGDGVWLESKDGKLKLTLSGGYNVLEQDGHDMLEWAASEDIIKTDAKHDYYRIVYYENKDIVHYYGKIDESYRADFSLSFPKEREKEFRSIIKRLERTLQLASDE